MTNCPHCQKSIQDTDIESGQCPHCGASIEEIAANDAGQTIPDAGLSSDDVAEDSDEGDGTIIIDGSNPITGGSFSDFADEEDEAADDDSVSGEDMATIQMPAGGLEDGTWDSDAEGSSDENLATIQDSADPDDAGTWDADQSGGDSIEDGATIQMSARDAGEGTWDSDADSSNDEDLATIQGSPNANDDGTWDADQPGAGGDDSATIQGSGDERAGGADNTDFSENSGATQTMSSPGSGEDVEKTIAGSVVDSDDDSATIMMDSGSDNAQTISADPNAEDEGDEDAGNATVIVDSPESTESDEEDPNAGGATLMMDVGADAESTIIGVTAGDVESDEESASSDDAAGATFVMESESSADQTMIVQEGKGSTFAIDDDPNLSKTLNEAWPTGIGDSANPTMTIRSERVKASSDRATLVIKQRSLREPEEHIKPGSEFEYELLGVLGEGGMGVVYDARQTSIDRNVAVKMIKGKTATDKVQRQKFLAEAVVTGDLDHPNIVPIYDVGSNTKGALFYSMKKVQGTPWCDVIEEYTLSHNVEILMKAADAVAFAHARGIVHRDLKPENTMLGEYGEVLVMDWGLAHPTALFRKNASIVETNSMGGTPAYMAPEMATGPIKKIGVHSDIYLLGAMLYEIVTGHPPHRGKTALKCLMEAAKNNIVPTDKTGELVDIALKAMATEPEDRFETVLDMQAAIREYQAHSESIVLAERAREDLQSAKATKDYQDFSRAMFGFQEAVALWDGNSAARIGLTDTQFAYAHCAYEKGDYDLGLSLLDEDVPDHADLRQHLLTAQREREARQQQLRMAKRIGAVTLVIFFTVISGAAYWINTERNAAIVARDEAEEQRVEANNQRIEADLQRQQAVDARAQEEIAKNDAIKAQQETEAARILEEQAKNDALVAQQEAEDARKLEEQAKNDAVEAQLAAEEARKAEEYEAYVARIGLAAAKIDENSFDAALQLLEGCKPELRNWEWGRLMHLCSQSDREFDAGAPVDSLAIAPDGTRFVTGGWNGEAIIWDLESGQALQKLDHAGLYVHSVAFSHDSNFVATGCNDPNAFVRVWDATTGEAIQTFNGHEDSVLSVAFSKDGRRLLTSSFDGTARLWDVETGTELFRFQGHNWWVWSARFSSDESQVVTASQDGTAIVWTKAESSSADEINYEAGPPFTGHSGPVYTADFSADGVYVASGGYDKRILLWKPDEVKPYNFENLNSGDSVVEKPEYRLLSGHKAHVRSVRFSHDGRLLVSGSHDNTVKVWSVETGSAIKTFRGHDSWVRACAFHPNGRSILSGSHDQHAFAWSIADYEEVRVLEGRVLEGHTDAVLAASFSKDGSRVVTASRDRTTKIWDVKSGDETGVFTEGHAFLASSAAFYPDGKTLFTGAVDNTVRKWDVSTGTELLRFDGTGRAAALALSSSTKWIVTGSTDRAAQLWDTETGSLIRRFEGHTSEVTAVAFSPDDAYIVTGDSAGHCRLWETETGRTVHRMEGHSRKITSVAYLPDGSRILSSSTDNTVGQWNPDTGKELRDLILKHPDPVTSMSVSIDGKFVATISKEALDRANHLNERIDRIWLWNVDTAELVTSIATNGPATNSVALSPDGRTIATASSLGRTVRRWDIESGAEILSRTADGETGPLIDFEKQGGTVWTAVFSPTGAQVVTVGGNSARLWDVQTGLERMEFSPHGAVASANFSPDGSRVITGSWDNSAKVWDTATGRAVMKLDGVHNGYVNSAVFSPDGQFILTASDDRTAILWSADDGEPIRIFRPHGDRVRSAVFSPDGTKILTTCNDTKARIWNTETAELETELEGHTWAVLSGAFSVDGKRVVTGSDDNTAKVWDVEGGTEIVLDAPLAGHTAGVTSVAFSPDGARILTGSRDDMVKLWDAFTGKEILTLDGHSEEVTSVSFSGNGAYALTSSRDGKAIIWLTLQWSSANDTVDVAGK